MTSAPPQVGSPSLDVGRDAAGRDLDDGAGEPLVGDHQVAAAAEHQHRLPRGVGGGDRVDQLLLGRRPHPGAGRSAEPQGGVVGEPLTAQTRTTAFGMPSTLWPAQVTSSATVASPSATA